MKCCDKMDTCQWNRQWGPKASQCATSPASCKMPWPLCSLLALQFLCVIFHHIILYTYITCTYFFFLFFYHLLFVGRRSFEFKLVCPLITPISSIMQYNHFMCHTSPLCRHTKMEYKRLS